MDTSVKELRLNRIREIALTSTSLAEKLTSRLVGLSVLESRVLLNLEEHPLSTPTEIAVRIMLTPVQVGRCVARLSKRSLVGVTSHAVDGRSIQLRLTKKGVQVHRTVAGVATVVLARLVRGFSSEERDALNALLGKLQANASDSEQEVLAAIDAIGKL
jgi:DNA-binding MarR family transcriptional regulator